jgi:hypothetical protein
MEFQNDDGKWDTVEFLVPDDRARVQIRGTSGSYKTSIILSAEEFHTLIAETEERLK